MLNLVINFLATMIITWCLMYLSLWILEKIALLTGSDFFRISTQSWTTNWKSWIASAVLALLFMP